MMKTTLVASIALMAATAFAPIAQAGTTCEIKGVAPYTQPYGPLSGAPMIEMWGNGLSRGPGWLRPVIEICGYHNYDRRNMHVYITPRGQWLAKIIMIDEQNAPVSPYHYGEIAPTLCSIDVDQGKWRSAQNNTCTNDLVPAALINVEGAGLAADATSATAAAWFAANPDAVEITE